MQPNRNFKNDYEKSEANDTQARVLSCLQSKFGKDSVMGLIKASRWDDKRGCDYWAVLSNGQKLAIDVKTRSKGYDDILLEIEAHGGHGWALDTQKITDYFVILYPKQSDLLAARELRAIVAANLEQWKQGQNGAKLLPPVKTTGYYESWQTLNLCVPVREFWRAYYLHFGKRTA